MPKVRPLLTIMTNTRENEHWLPESRAANAHLCDMPLEIDHLAIATPGNSVISKFLRAFRAQCLVSPSNPRTKQLLQSRASIVLEKIRHLRFHYWTVHPFSNFRSVWELAMTILMTASLLLLPFHVAFSEHRYRSDDFFLDMGNLMFDFICITDVIMTFFTGTIHMPSHSVTLRKDVIARQYLYGWFALDFITALPFETLLAPAYSITDSVWYNNKLSYLKCVSLIKIYRLRILYMYFNRSVKVYKISAIPSKITHRVIFCGLYLHWMSSFSFLIPRLIQLGNDDQNAWNKPDRDSWLSAANLWTADRLTRYVHSWYHVIRISLRVAFAHNVPITYEDTLVTMLTAALGFFLVVYVAATSIYILSVTNNPSYKYEEDTGRLREFMRMKQLPPGFQNRLLMLKEAKLQDHASSSVRFDQP